MEPRNHSHPLKLIFYVLLISRTVFSTFLPILDLDPVGSGTFCRILFRSGRDPTLSDCFDLLVTWEKSSASSMKINNLMEQFTKSGCCFYLFWKNQLAGIGSRIRSDSDPNPRYSCLLLNWFWKMLICCAADLVQWLYSASHICLWVVARRHAAIVVCLSPLFKYCILFYSGHLFGQGDVTWMYHRYHKHSLHFRPHPSMTLQ